MRLVAKGRKARETDTTPGKVLLLALVANLPVFLGFVVLPVARGGDRSASFAAVPYVLYGTPIVALGALVVYLRAPTPRKQHAAARMGLALTVVAFVFWALILVTRLSGRA